MKAIKPKKILGQSLFKNHLKFQNFNKVFYCDMAKHVRKYMEVFRKYIYAKTTVRKKVWDKIIFENFLRVTVSLK